MKQKVDNKIINELKSQFSRFALYDDYKDLYNKTVMPV
jgi:hypothetical protein